MKRYTRRCIEKACRKTLGEGKILVLIGARQTGKSTLSRELLKEIPEVEKLTLNLDDPFLRDRLVQTENSLIRSIEEKAQKPWSDIDRFFLLIDEAQKAPELFERVKALHDAEQERIALILTGSSALEIHDPVAETLAGRARIFHLFPFTLSEGFAHQQGEHPSDSHAEMISRLLCGRFGGGDFEALVNRARRDSSQRRSWVEKQLRFPLFPEPSLSDQPEQWLRDYLATYLEKDIQSLAALGNAALFRAAIRQIAARVGSTIKWETAAQQLGTTSVTLRKYVGLMEQTFNLIRLSPFAANPVKRVVHAPKLYLIDGGLLWGLRGFEDLRLLQASGMLGVYAEQAAIVEIAKWCSMEPTAPELRFWSKTAVSEVDLVVSNRGYHIPFEIKLGQNFDPQWLRGLNAFEEDHRALDLQIPYRIVVHQGEPSRPDDRTYAIPLWMFA